MPLTEKMYLDYFNNYLTIERFAEHNEMSVTLAALIIKEGRAIHHARFD